MRLAVASQLAEHGYIRLSAAASADPMTVRAPRGRLNALRVFYRKCSLDCVFVWAHAALHSRLHGFRAGQLWREAGSFFERPLAAKLAHAGRLFLPPPVPLGACSSPAKRFSPG